MTGADLFTSLLTLLGTPHTQAYSIARINGMPFKSMFGLSKLLKEYGIDNIAVQLGRKQEYTALPTPFIASVGNVMSIVTGVSSAGVTISKQPGESETMPQDSFLQQWSGIALLVYPNPDAIEPDYKRHRYDEIAQKAKKSVLIASVLFLFLYLFTSNGLYRHISTILLTAINAAGLFITYLLVLKQMSIHTRTADKICGIIQQNGCNTVLQTSGAKFFGLFGWSEVGFAYFGVSLLTLLIFPQFIGYLALTNACCLPFSLWSVWYQKTRAKAWCTLCLCVQASLWLLFFCYLSGGWFRDIFPIRIELFVLGAAYLTALLALNRLLPLFDRSTNN